MDSLQIQLRPFLIVNLNISLLLKPCLPKLIYRYTACGQHHLSAALGSRQIAKEYVNHKD